MDETFKCGNVEIENVAEFKYLGLIINRANSNPSSMLEQRLCKAKQAFYSIKSHARLLGLHNRRVRI